MIYLQANDEAIIQGYIRIIDVYDVTELAVALRVEMGSSVDDLVDAGVVDSSFHPRETSRPQINGDRQSRTPTLQALR